MSCVWIKTGPTTLFNVALAHELHISGYNGQVAVWAKVGSSDVQVTSEYTDYDAAQAALVAIAAGLDPVPPAGGSS